MIIHVIMTMRLA